MLFRGISSRIREAHGIKSRVAAAAVPNGGSSGSRRCLGVREMSSAEFGKGGGLKVMAIRRSVLLPWAQPQHAVKINKLLTLRVMLNYQSTYFYDFDTVIGLAL